MMIIITIMCSIDYVFNLKQCFLQLVLWERLGKTALLIVRAKMVCFVTSSAGAATVHQGIMGPTVKQVRTVP